MKGKKSKFKENLCEALIELILGAIISGIGFIIFWIFRIKINWDNLDPDILFLAGLGVIFTFGVIYVIATKAMDFIKNRFKK